MVCVSVLTPVYNVERFLPQCLDSLMAQTLQDAEFILVNDGSTDASLQILRDYAARDARFVVLDKPNSGYGASMNLGLAQARGDYIGIIEPDDYVDAECFERLYEAATTHGGCDIAKANYYEFSDEDEAAGEGGGQVGGQLMRTYPNELCGRVISLLDYAPELLKSNMTIWAGIYRRAFVEEHGIRFLESPGASFQDTGFVMKSWIAADTVYLVDDAFVHYRRGHESSSTLDPGKVNCILDEYASIYEFAHRFPARYDALAPVLASQRFKAYRWNLNRIGRQHKAAFAQAAAEQFRTAEREGALDEAQYSKKGWAQLQAWMVDPVEYARNGLPRVPQNPQKGSVLGKVGRWLGKRSRG